jgi:hypothetical protein
MLEMGGASTQIANFENNGDLMVSNKIFLAMARWREFMNSWIDRLID